MNKIKLSVFVSGLIFSAAAFATGGIDCTSENKDIKFSVSATTARAFGSPVVDLKGTLQFKGESLIQDIMSLDLEQSNLVGYWSLTSGTKMAFNYEGGTDDFGGTVMIVLETKPSKAGTQSGQLTIEKIINGVAGIIEKKFSSKVKCITE